MHPDFIEIYPDIITEDTCNTIIDGIDNILDNRVTPYMQKHTVADRRVDAAIFAEHDYQEAHKIINDALGRAIELYIEKYSIIDHRDTKVVMPFSTWSVKLQKTPIGGGFHQWHCENRDRKSVV